jgi:hypothetical protein
MRRSAPRLPLAIASALVLLLLAALASAGEGPTEFPHQKELKKCPRCSALFDAAPHPTDYRDCPLCQAALAKAQAYLKKNFNPQFFGLILDSFFGGFAFMMDRGENHEKELAVCARNCRNLIVKPTGDGNFANASDVGEDWCSWKKSMAMYFLAEYSLRYGLNPENKAALVAGAEFATKTQQKGGGWFHSAPKEQQYSPDIAIIGCIFYAAFLEMKALGVDPGPILDQTRTYLESVSDGKTIGYSKGWHGGMGGGGADGFINLGLLGSGHADDRWGAGLAAWMKQNYMDAGHGHANGELHYFALGAALHRLGPEHYAKFATCHVHRLIEVQREDGSVPGLSHDNPNETEFFQKLKSDPKAQGNYASTAVFACLLLMEQPGAFSPLPSKPPGSLSNKDAFKNGMDALARQEYAKAYGSFAQVLPPGDAGELIPQAREQLQKIEAIGRQRLQALQSKESELTKGAQDRRVSKERLTAYADMIHAYEAFQKDFAGCTVSREALKCCEPLRKTLSDMRLRLAYGDGSASGPTVKPRNAEALKDWEGKLKTRLQALLAAGRKPRIELRALKSRITLNALDAKDNLDVSVEGGGKMTVTWRQFEPQDLLDLALAIAAGDENPEGHAVAAFFLLNANDSARAQDHLAKAGDFGAAVRAAFTDGGAEGK